MRKALKLRARAFANERIGRGQPGHAVQPRSWAKNEGGPWNSGWGVRSSSLRQGLPSCELGAAQALFWKPRPLSSA